MHSEGYSSCLVCVLCLSGHVILAARAIKSIMKDTIVLHQICAILKWCFFLKFSYSKVRAFLLTLARVANFS